MPGAPPYYLRAEARYNTSSGFYFGPNLEWVPQGYFVDNVNNPAFMTAPYALLGVKAGYTGFKGVEIFVDARNLTNNMYVSNVGVINTALADQPALQSRRRRFRLRRHPGAVLIRATTTTTRIPPLALAAAAGLHVLVGIAVLDLWQRSSAFDEAQPIEIEIVMPAAAPQPEPERTDDEPVTAAAEPEPRRLPRPKRRHRRHRPSRKSSLSIPPSFPSPSRRRRWCSNHPSRRRRSRHPPKPAATPRPAPAVAATAPPRPLSRHLPRHPPRRATIRATSTASPPPSSASATTRCIPGGRAIRAAS